MTEAKHFTVSAVPPEHLQTLLMLAACQTWQDPQLPLASRLEAPCCPRTDLCADSTMGKADNCLILTAGYAAHGAWPGHGLGAGMLTGYMGRVHVLTV